MAKVIVIGGGPAGLTAAIHAAKSGNSVTILERNNKCGKKLNITGNGHCNYYNDDQHLNHYHTNDNDLITNIINKDNTNKYLEFFKYLGIVPRIKNGYHYPMSNQASSITNALIAEALANNVEIINDTLVNTIKKEKELFKIKTNNGDFICDKVILATGSKACPKTGSDGLGYELLKDLGHTITNITPSLVQVKSDDKITKECAGVRSDVVASLYVNDELIKEEKGEIQFTDYGLSGICIFNLSGYAKSAIDLHKNVAIRLNFLANLNIFDEEQAYEFLNNYMNDKNISLGLDNLFNYKLTNALLKILKINGDSKWNDLKTSEKTLLVNNLIAYKVNLTDTNSFDKAQACRGGVPLQEINLKTMESNIIKNLYLAGEIVDIDGDCGGYNLTVAFITGMLAGSGTKND